MTGECEKNKELTSITECPEWRNVYHWYGEHDNRMQSLVYKSHAIKLLIRQCARKGRRERRQQASPVTSVVYHSPKFSGKSGWKVNGIRLFGSFYRKISGSNKTSEKIVLFFRTEYSKLKFVCHFFNAIFETGFRLSRSFFRKWD